MVGELSSIAQTHGLHIEHSQITALSAEFAVSMAVSGSDDITDFEKALARLNSGDLAHRFRRNSAADDRQPGPSQHDPIVRP